MVIFMLYIYKYIFLDSSSEDEFVVDSEGILYFLISYLL